jgi:hypothetical protein
MNQENRKSSRRATAGFERKEKILILPAAVLVIVGLIWVVAFFSGGEPSGPAAPLPQKGQSEKNASSRGPELPHRMPGPLEAPAPRPAPAHGEDAISGILSDQSLDFPAAVDRLLKLLPSLDEEAQVEAANHISNLSDDKKAGEWTPLLVANRLPPAAQEVLFNDLLNRPHELTMPTLSAIADATPHPQQKESREILDVLYGTPPPGTTWTVWVAARMKEEPQ